MKTRVFILTLLVVISGVMSKGKKPKPKPYNREPKWLVVTGGEKSDGSYLQSSEIVSYFGVCPNPAKIPDLVPEMSEGESVWVDGKIVFCGGTQYGGNAQKFCWKLKPGDSDWAKFDTDLLSARALYSLTIMNNKPDQLLAVGGVGEDGTCLDTMEYYRFRSKDLWRSVTVKLPEPTCGQCAVRLGKKTVMIIGGGPAKDTATNYVWKIMFNKFNKATVKPLQVLPVPLWRPACDRVGGHRGSIYVSGGLLSDGSPSADVYKYNIKTNTWSPSPIGALKTARYGHVMGRTTEKQTVVAGGYDNAGSLSSIEDSYNYGEYWRPRTQALGEARKYAAMAEVPPFLFNCD